MARRIPKADPAPMSTAELRRTAELWTTIRRIANRPLTRAELCDVAHLLNVPTLALVILERNHVGIIDLPPFSKWPARSNFETLLSELSEERLQAELRAAALQRRAGGG